MVSYIIVFIVVGNDVNTPRVQDEVAMVSHVKGCHSLVGGDETYNKSILHLLSFNCMQFAILFINHYIKNCKCTKVLFICTKKL